MPCISRKAKMQGLYIFSPIKGRDIYIKTLPWCLSLLNDYIKWYAILQFLIYKLIVA